MADAGGGEASRARVFVFEAHDLTREGLVGLLEEEGFEAVGASGRPAEAVEAIVALRPDACVLGLGPGDWGGIGVCRAVCGLAPDIPCIILATRDDPAAAAEAFRAGARGYVLQALRGDGLGSALRRAVASPR